jgi:uncharacterized surface protein with fasciclin (FAS1) repeats
LSGNEFEVENSDGAVTADGIPVTMADLAASNGVVHVITERPILPDCLTLSISALGAANPDFSTRVTYIDSAGLVALINITRPLTLVAPSNDAFSVLDDSARAYLESNATALKELLEYHLLFNITLFKTTATSDGEYKICRGKEFPLSMLTEFLLSMIRLKLSVPIFSRQMVWFTSLTKFGFRNCLVCST